MPSSKTVSTCTSEAVQGTHVFDVFGYSQHRGIGVDKYIRSGTFFVGGHDWAIRFYPDGFSVGNPRNRSYIIVLLELLSKSAKVRASVDLGLVDQSTGLSSSVRKTVSRVFNPDDCTRFAFYFLKERSKFEASAYLRDDRFTIECIVTVIKEPRVSETRASPRIEMPPSDIVAHLGKLLEEKEGADVTFSVGGEEFAAHKAVLAMRSPVFKAELLGPMRQTGTQPIAVKDMQPDVFRALLHFVYTDSLPAMDDLDGDDQSEMIHHLLVAADRYAMERLKLMCESILCKSLRVQTVATTLALADQHHCSILKDACTEFILSLNRMDDLVATQGFVSLKRTCPSVLVDALVKMSKLRKT